MKRLQSGRDDPAGIVVIAAIHYDWSREVAGAVYDASFMDIVFRAGTAYRTVFNPNKVQYSRLLIIETGGCLEDCDYCSQSALHGWC